MVIVTKRKGDTKDSVFKRFTKLFIEEEIVDEVRNRMFYKKPSQVNKEEEKERKKNKNRRTRTRTRTRTNTRIRK